MTIAPHEPATTSTDVALAADPAGLSAVVARYAQDLSHCAELAAQLVDTPFVPAAFWPAPVIEHGQGQVVTLKASGRDGWDFRRRHPRESDEAFAWRRSNAIATTAAIVYSGAVLGINWQAAVSGIYVANGRTSLYAEQMRALVLAAGHRFDIVERSPERCVVEVARAGGRPTTFSFTMDEAISAGYVQGKGPNVGQDSWKGNARYNSNPADMLFARATTTACKAMFPDVIRGMEARETMFDEQPVDITATAEVLPAPRLTGEAIREAAQTARAAASGMRDVPPSGPSSAELVNDGAAPEPAGEPQAAAAAAPTPALGAAPGTIEQSQWRQINDRFSKIGGTVRGLTGPGQASRRLFILREIVGRDLTQGRELSRSEARKVLDNLAGEAGERLVRGILDSLPGSADDEPAPGDPVEQARAVEADVEQQIADARADADAKAAAAAAEASQADQYDPTTGGDPWAGVDGEAGR